MGIYHILLNRHHLDAEKNLVSRCAALTLLPVSDGLTFTGSVFINYRRWRAFSLPYVLCYIQI